MKPRVWLSILALAGVGVLVWQLMAFKNQPPQVPFAKAVRESITSAVSTNGKAEPIEWANARAERSGGVSRIAVQRGQRVTKDQVLVELDAADAKSELASAEARMQAARAEINTLGRGGRAPELSEISASLDRAHLDLENAQREYNTLVRLQSRQAATKAEVTAAKEVLDKVQLQIKSLEAKRGSLVAVEDRSAAEAKLHEAEAAAQLAQDRIHKSAVRSPIDGVVYQFELKPGAYLNAGDVVASIGQLERIHVNVFVDEPDLGRVNKGMPVVITWDALPGRQWKGTVEKTPTQIVPLGARQVGEVICTIENPNLDLLPGTNVNAEIRTETVANAITIPKEAIRRENGKDGVYTLDGVKLLWKPVSIGVNNVTRAQIPDLSEGAPVALPTEEVLSNGLVVRAVFR